MLLFRGFHWARSPAGCGREGPRWPAQPIPGNREAPIARPAIGTLARGESDFDRTAGEHSAGRSCRAHTRSMGPVRQLSRSGKNLTCLSLWLSKKRCIINENNKLSKIWLPPRRLRKRAARPQHSGGGDHPKQHLTPPFGHPSPKERGKFHRINNNIQ